MSDTVLAHVVAAFPQKENLGTEALAFIMNRSAPAREAIRRKIAEVVGDLPVIARVVTQPAVGDESRPDLILLGHSGETIGFIEAKFWAGLTPSQPVEYIRRLADHGGVLVMLAPEQRLATLRAEVMERCRKADLTMDVSARTVSVANTRVGFVSWSALLATLRDAVAEDPASASDVRQLAGLCRGFEQEGFIPLTRQEIDDLSVPRRYSMLAGLVDEIVDVAIAATILNVRGLRATPLPQGPGRYVGFARAGAWLGLDHYSWARWGRSPIWFVFAKSPWGRAEQMAGALRSWMATDPASAYRAEDGSMHVSLLLPDGVEKDVVVANAIGQIRALDASMAAAGMAPLGPPPAKL